MTVSSSTSKVSFSGNGSLTTFAYSFKIFDQDDLTVILRAADGTETVQTITTHYTVTGVGSASGGNVVFGSAPASGVTVVILREQPLSQGLDLVANDPFPAESLEEALDKLVFMTQKHEEELSRAIKGSRTNVISNSEFTVSATDRANKLFSFDSSGNLSIAQELGTFRGNWATSTSYNVRDLVKDTSTNNIFLVNTAHTSSGSQPLTTNANSAKYDLIVDAATATTAQTAAASSATSAAASATTATTKASEAATSATASETAKTASETAKTASETAQAASEAALDSFDDRYLGAKSTSGGDPTTDNDGDALIDGALFFDTTNNVMKVYNLGTTTWLRTTPTTTEQGHINTVSGISANVTTVAGISSNVTTVAGISSDVTTVAADGTDIGTVAGISSNVTTVAGISGNVTTVAGISSDVTAVAGDATDIGTVATNISNVNAVGGISANVTTVAGIASNVTTVAGISANVTTVAGDTTNIGTIATNLGGTDTIGTVAGSISNVNSVGGSITNVNTVASSISDVNSFANQYRISAQNPTTSLDAGDLAYVTDDTVLKYYNGTNWVSISPGIGNVSDDTSPALGGNLDANGNEIALDDGSSTTNRLKFGASDDLQIYHDSAANINTITGNGSNTTTDTYIYTNDNFAIRKGTPSSSETMIFGTGDGAVYLYHNGSTRLTTSSIGVSVTGDVTTSDDLFVNGGFARISSSSTATLQLMNTDTTASDQQELGVIDFFGSDSSSPGAGVKASIKAVAESSGGDGASLKFYTSTTVQNELLAAEFDRYQNLNLYNSPVLRFYDTDASHYGGFDIPSSVTSSYTLTLPAAAPSAADQILVSDASGNLSFENKPVAGGTAFSAF